MKLKPQGRLERDEGVYSGGIAPVEFFFRQEVDCFYAKEAVLDPKLHRLPCFAQLFQRELDAPFATVLMGYTELGLHFSFVVESSKVQVFYPDIEKGDSIQLFIDTRDVRQAKTTHRFCHHFFFLPEAYDEKQCGEITRFRTEETHPLCVSSELELAVERNRSGYSASIFIPAHSLVGYAPGECPRLGFTYKICRADGAVQEFGITSSSTRYDQAPYLWTTMLLK